VLAVTVLLRHMHAYMHSHAAMASSSSAFANLDPDIPLRAGV
jgi:hypothetical protein